MEWLEYIILLLNKKCGHEIKYRHGTSGKFPLRFYITAIDGTKYRTDDQVVAKNHMRKIIEEELA